MAESGLGIVVDIGNSRLKWGKVDAAGSLVWSTSLPFDPPHLDSELRRLSDAIPRKSSIAISSVNPPVANKLEILLRERKDGLNRPTVRWYRSAESVPIPHQLEYPETAGADRALAVAAAMYAMPKGAAGLVVSCGTAITVERITSRGIWQGGAIAPGFMVAARSLNQNTAQLPLIRVASPPPAWGNSTRPALEAGIFWGVVGGVRELLNRQSDDLSADPWVVWTGGDAELLAGVIAGAEARIIPNLVLEGLARVSGVGRRE